MAKFTSSSILFEHTQHLTSVLYNNHCREDLQCRMKKERYFSFDMGKSDEYWTLFIVDSLHRLVLVLSPSTSHLVNDDYSLLHGKKNEVIPYSGKLSREKTFANW